MEREVKSKSSLTDLHNMIRRGKKYLSLLLFVLIFMSCGSSKEIIEDFRTNMYIDRMEQFSKETLSGGEIVFFGNSITEGGKWNEYFNSEKKIVNRGIAGDNTEGMLSRINLVASDKPSKIFIMAGINDISLSRSNSKILTNYKALIHEIKRVSPETVIYIQSVLPINGSFGVYTRLNGKGNQILSLNMSLKNLAKSEEVEFINLFPLFANESGELYEKFTYDGIHINAEAYQLWANIIRNKVE